MASKELNMPANVKPVPEGYATITPHLVCKDGQKALAFYEKAFGARVLSKSLMPGSDKLMHAEIEIGNARVMLADEFPDWGSLGANALGGSPVVLHLYCEDTDAVMARAEAAGAEITMPAADMFWGDRYGKLADPFGHQWSVGTKIANPTQEEMEQAMNAMFGGDGGYGEQ